MSLVCPLMLNECTGAPFLYIMYAFVNGRYSFDWIKQTVL